MPNKNPSPGAIVFSIILVGIFYCPLLNAQEITPLSGKLDTAAIIKPVPTQTDLATEWRKWRGKKMPKAKDTGRQQHAILPAVGYAEQTGFAAVLAGSYIFYPVKINQENQAPSTLLASVTYSQYNQVIIPIAANIWSKNNTYNAVIDWRFMAYPSTTFGLGGNTKLSDGYTIDFDYIKLHESLLRKISKNLYGGLGLYYDRFWNVREILDSDNMATTSFEKYGFSKQSTAVGLALRLLLDSRDNPLNASKGAYINMVERANFTFLGSDANWNSMLIEIRKYLHFPASSKNVLALWSYNWLTLGGKPPYLLLPSTGWDDFFNTGRGYIQGRYRAKDMVYLEGEYRFSVTNNGLLGMVVFANSQSFSRNINQQFHLLTPAFGTGIRIKLNKITGTNLCIDYGVGVDGSHGVAVNLGEVF
jgi:hypothetical protein